MTKKSHEILVKELTQKVRELISKDLDKAVKTIENWVDYDEKIAQKHPGVSKQKKNEIVRKKAA